MLQRRGCTRRPQRSCKAAGVGLSEMVKTTPVVISVVKTQSRDKEKEWNAKSQLIIRRSC